MRKNCRSIFLSFLLKVGALIFVFLFFSCNPEHRANGFASTIHLDFGKNTALSVLKDLHSNDTIPVLDQMGYLRSGDSIRDVELSFTSPYTNNLYRCILLGLPSQGCTMSLSLTPEDSMTINTEYQEKRIESVFLLQEERGVIHFYNEELILLENGPTTEVLDYAFPRFTDIALFGAICGWHLQKDTAYRLLNILTEKSYWYSEDQGILNSTKYLDLHFWATWCGPCLAEFQRMDTLFFSAENRLFIALEYNRKAPQFIYSSYSMRQAVQIYPFLLSDYSVGFLPTDIRYFPSTGILWYQE